MDVNSSHEALGAGKTQVSPEMAGAVMDLLNWYGQNQAGLALDSGLSASTISGILRVSENGEPKAIKTATWNSLLKGLQQTMQLGTADSDVSSEDMRSHRRLLRIGQHKLSIPGDVLAGNFANYVKRVADSQMETRLETDSARLMCTAGGHKIGHTSFLRETTRQAEDAGFKVRHVDLEADLAFEPNWEPTFFWQTLAESLEIDPPPPETSPVKLAMHFANALQDSKQFITIDGLQRSLMNRDQVILKSQLEFICKLPLILSRWVKQVESQDRIILILMAGPFAFFDTRIGDAFHQSRVQMTHHPLEHLDRAQCAALYKAVIGKNPTESDIDALHDVLSGHPYLTHAALDDLKRSGSVLPIEASDFCHNAACKALIKQCETSFDILRSFLDAENTDLKTFVRMAADGDSKARTFCLELGLAHHPRGGHYRILPVIDAYFENGTHNAV